MALQELIHLLSRVVKDPRKSFLASPVSSSLCFLLAFKIVASLLHNGCCCSSHHAIFKARRQGWPQSFHSGTFPLCRTGSQAYFKTGLASLKSRDLYSITKDQRPISRKERKPGKVTIVLATLSRHLLLDNDHFPPFQWLFLPY